MGYGKRIWLIYGKEEKDLRSGKDWIWMKKKRIFKRKDLRRIEDNRKWGFEKRRNRRNEWRNRKEKVNESKCNEIWCRRRRKRKYRNGELKGGRNILKRKINSRKWMEERGRI